MEAFYRATLRWAVGAPTDMRAAALHLITASIPLHGLILKHTVRYYGTLERDKAAYCAVEDALATADTQSDADQLRYQLLHLRQPRWAADFVRSAVEEVVTGQHNMRSARLTTSSIEGLVALRTYHSLEAASTSVQWIYDAYAQLISEDLRRSRRLISKGLNDLLASVALLCFGGA